MRSGLRATLSVSGCAVCVHCWQYNTKNSSDRTTETAVYTGAPLRGPDLSLNMHSQQSMNYTHWAAQGDVASAAVYTRQHICDSRAVAHRAAPCSRQGTIYELMRYHWQLDGNCRGSFKQAGK
jgi:hypothetical protein